MSVSGNEFVYRCRTKLDPEELAGLRSKVLTQQSYNLLVNPQGGPVRVLKPNGDPLFVYRPQAIAQDLRDLAYPVLTKIRAKSDNRGHASGSVVVKNGKQDRSLPVASTILGSFEARTGRHPVCRLTAWTGSNADKFESIFPYIRAVAAEFGQGVPDRYEVQQGVAAETEKDWMIADTPFTTITVNNSYATGVHVDDGDLEEGFSCITVLRRGQYAGGQLVFPEYRVAVDFRDGDVLLMDAHEWHGNTQLDLQSDDAERISVVLYYRTNMKKCEAQERELEKAKRKAGLIV